MNKKTIKRLLLIALACMIAASFGACSKKDAAQAAGTDPVSGETQALSTDAPQLSLKLSEARIEVGKTATAETTANASCTGEIQIISSDPSIVSVSGNTLTAAAPGTAAVYAQCGNAKSDEISVECIIYATGISLNKESVSLQIGGETTLSASLTPENVTEKTISWSSSDKEIASVSKNGTVTGRGAGTATITAKDASGKLQATCKVTVSPIEVTDVSFSESSIKLGKGQKFIVTSSVSPENATYKSLDFSVSDSSVVSYSGNTLTAKSAGTAKVTAKAHNGKSDSFTVTVTNQKPSTTMYATSNVNLRSGKSANSKSLKVVSSGTAVEVVKSGTWAMVNTGGQVGYIKSSYLSSVKPVKISGVPYFNQFSLGYPTGCEAVSATMVLHYYGYNVSAKTIVNATPSGEAKHKENGKWVGANPFEEFVGHPSKNKTYGSYGCFAAPIVTAMKTVAGSRVKNISGCSADTLFDYVADGHPVVVWCVKNAGNLQTGVTWTYPDGSGKFTELSGEHCAVLIGYDSENVYLNDPSAGKNVTQPKSKFISNWKKLYSQAIIIQ